MARPENFAPPGNRAARPWLGDRIAASPEGAPLVKKRKKRPELDPESLAKIEARFSAVRGDPFMEYLMKTVVEYLLERGRPHGS